MNGEIHGAPRPTTIDAETISVGDNAYAYVQHDGSWWINNAGFVVGSDGVVLIDTCSTEQRTRALLGSIRSLTDAPIQTVVNTHHHGDHTYGNCLTAPAPIISHRLCREAATRTGIKRYEETFQQPDWGSLQFRPPTITFESRLDLWADDTLIELHAIGHPAHTSNDVVAWLPAQRVLYTGDLVFHGGTPFILMGSATGSLRALDALRAFEAVTVVPGHGKLCTPSVFDDIERYLRMITRVAKRARTSGASPLEAARELDLGEFATLGDSERLVGNLHRAMAELEGPAANDAVSLSGAIADMVTLRGGPLLPCSA